MTITSSCPPTTGVSGSGYSDFISKHPTATMVWAKRVSAPGGEFAVQLRLAPRRRPWQQCWRLGNRSLRFPNCYVLHGTRWPARTQRASRSNHLAVTATSGERQKAHMSPQHGEPSSRAANNQPSPIRPWSTTSRSYRSPACLSAHRSEHLTRDVRAAQATTTSTARASLMP